MLLKHKNLDLKTKLSRIVVIIHYFLFSLQCYLEALDLFDYIIERISFFLLSKPKF